MKTQKELLKQIKLINQQINNLLHNSDELKEIERTYAEKRTEYFFKIRPQREKLYKELSSLNDELSKIRKKKELKLSKRLQDWLDGYTRGVNWGPKGLIIKEILDEQERFVLISNPGHLYWSGRGEFSYGTSRWWIADTFSTASFLNDVGSHLSNGRVMGKDIEGRLTKEKKKELLDALEEYKKLNGIK